MTEAEKTAVLGADMNKRFRGASSAGVLAPIRRRFEAAAHEPSALNWMTYLALNLRLPELLLARVDKMTMATSVEARVPFLDHDLVDFAQRIPVEHKLRDLDRPEQFIDENQAGKLRWYEAQRGGGKVVLRPANPALTDMVFNEGDVMIYGRVVTVLRRL